MSAFSELIGDKMIDNTGKLFGTKILSDNKIVALYFSAHWCMFF